MTLVLELPDKKEAALKARARAQGVSAEQYAQHVLDRDLEETTPAEPRDDRPIWEVITEIMKDVPDEVFDRLPKYAASQVDHYSYDLPKTLANPVLQTLSMGCASSPQRRKP